MVADAGATLDGAGLGPAAISNAAIHRAAIVESLYPARGPMGRQPLRIDPQHAADGGIRCRGVVAGNQQPGDVASIEFPGGMTRFGFYLNPNGELDATNAPEPEKFYTNRFLNDVGANGTADFHGPNDGDPQCLVYNITHLRQGVPTFVLAWDREGTTIWEGALPYAARRPEIGAGGRLATPGWIVRLEAERPEG